MTRTWHADQTLLDGYAGGSLDDARALSLEAHVLACGACREALSSRADRASLDRMWAEVTDVLDAPATGPIERVLRRIGVPDHAARLLAATPSLRLSWLVGQAVALGQAVVIARLASGEPREQTAMLLFLMLAALLPVLGVAVAYGPGVDPTYEIGVASPMRGFRLLLIRATAVLAVSVAIGALAALAMPGRGWEAFAWLLPSFGLTLATLALSTAARRPLTAAVVVTAGWLVVAVGLQWGSGDRFAAFRVGAQLGSLVLIAVSGWALAHRRRTFEEGAFR
jgi:hypothetical protein